MNDNDLLAEQIAYYRAVAWEHELHAINEPGADELLAAFEAFRPSGHVLELACGPGAWTERLLEHASRLAFICHNPTTGALL